MKRTLLILTALALAACAPNPPQTLEQRLSGKSPAEKQEILRVACLNEAERLGNPPREDIRTHHGVKLNQDSAQTRRFKEICREMTDAYPAESTL